MAIKWGYSLNCWHHQSNSVRKDVNERNFKVCSVAGFKGVEMQIGAGRWSPLGFPTIIGQIYGGAKEYKEYLEGLGITDVVGWDCNPARLAGMHGRGYNPSVKEDWGKIAEAVVPYVKFLQEVGSKYLICRPMASWWQEAPVTDEKIAAAAECWNTVGKVTEEYGVKIVLCVDWLCAANSVHAIDLLMEKTDPALVGLCVDTGELAMVQIDPQEVYEAHADRVDLFHFSQVFVADTLEEYKKPFAEDIITNGGERGIVRWFWEMNCPEDPGLVDFEKLMKSIRAHGYDGWIVVVDSQTPEPAASVLFNSWYVQKVLSKI